jgi:hypothetical protein
MGMLAAPGRYSATLAKEVDSQIETLTGPIYFDVVPMREGALQGNSLEEAAAFWRSYESTVRNVTAVRKTLSLGTARIEAMRKALSRATVAPGDLDERLTSLQLTLQEIEDELYGNRAKRDVGEKTKPTIGDRLFSVELGIGQSTYGPTTTHRRTLEIVDTQLEQIKVDLATAWVAAEALGEELQEAGAPWVEGSPLP